MDVLSELCKTFPNDIESLSKLVALSSPTHNGAAVTLVQQELRAALESLDMRCTLVPEPSRGMHLLAKTAAVQTAERSLHLVAHADTVHAANRRRGCLRIEGRVPEQLPPKKGQAPVVRAYGPGSLDLKASLVCVMSALRLLARVKVLQRIPLTFFVNSCEEDGTAHSAKFITDLAKHAGAALVFEFGRDGNRIVTQRKGVRTYRLDIIGRAAHSGQTTSQAENAIANLFRIGGEFQALCDPKRGVTLNLGAVTGGSRVNVIAERAALAFEIRAPRMADLDREEATVLGILNRRAPERTRLTCTSAVPPMRASSSSTLLRKSYAWHGQSVGLGGGHAPLQGGVSDANFYAAAGVPTIDGLGPWGEHPHSKDEYVDLCSIPYKAANLVLWFLDETSKGWRRWVTPA